MKKFLNSIVLFLVAITLATVLFPLGFVYAIYHALRYYRNNAFTAYLSKFFYSVALGIDKTGNVVLGPLFNLIMLHKSSKSYLFGDINDTISYTLARNLTLNNIHFEWCMKDSKNVTWLGWWLICFLERLDPNHMRKSIERRY